MVGDVAIWCVVAMGFITAIKLGVEVWNDWKHPGWRRWRND